MMGSVQRDLKKRDFSTPKHQHQLLEVSDLMSTLVAKTGYVTNTLDRMLQESTPNIEGSPHN